MKNKLLIYLLLLFILNGCVGTSSQGLFGTGVSIAIDPRSLGTQIDDNIMEKNLKARLLLEDKKYLLSINSKVLEYISKLQNNEHTAPIVVPGGFLILKLNETKQTKRNINLEQELETIIKTKTNDQLNQFSNIFLNKIKKEFTINEL